MYFLHGLSSQVVVGSKCKPFGGQVVPQKRRAQFSYSNLSISGRGREGQQGLCSMFPQSVIFVDGAASSKILYL